MNATVYMQDSFNIKLRCSVPDDPRARFLHWTKDGKQIYSDRGKMGVLPSGDFQAPYC